MHSKTQPPPEGTFEPILSPAPPRRATPVIEAARALQAVAETIEADKLRIERQFRESVARLEKVNPEAAETCRAIWEAVERL